MYRTTRITMITALAICLTCLTVGATARAEELGTSGFVANGDVKIHYITAGDGPLVVMLHGFPDFWYTWRHQIPTLSQNHRVVAIDLRGYNKSDQPVGIEHYTLPKLVSDVEAVVEHFGDKRATIVGHDWGGMLAWSFAMQHPDKLDRLVVLNLPHPACLTRELANNPAQREASAYARRFQQPDAAEQLTAEGLAFWVQDPEAKKRYVAAFRRSSFDAMLNYYKANFPTEPYREKTDYPKVKCPVLLIHGLEDTALLPEGLDGTWNHVEETLTMVTIPGAGHFVQQDAAERVTRLIADWLVDRTP